MSRAEATTSIRLRIDRLRSSIVRGSAASASVCCCSSPTRSEKPGIRGIAGMGGTLGLRGASRLRRISSASRSNRVRTSAATRRGTRPARPARPAASASVGQPELLRPPRGSGRRRRAPAPATRPGPRGGTRRRRSADALDLLQQLPLAGRVLLRPPPAAAAGPRRSARAAGRTRSPSWRRGPLVVAGVARLVERPRPVLPRTPPGASPQSSTRASSRAFVPTTASEARIRVLASIANSSSPNSPPASLGSSPSSSA